jgi:hypothetical protein
MDKKLTFKELQANTTNQKLRFLNAQQKKMQQFRKLLQYFPIFKVSNTPINSCKCLTIKDYCRPNPSNDALSLFKGRA